MINQFTKSVTNLWKIKDISKIRTESKKLIGLSLDPENEVFCSDLT
jgi:hypothetical protein